MGPLELVKLTRLMQRTSGHVEIKIGLIDGPVAMHHPDLTGQNVRGVNGKGAATCVRASSVACMHGTFVAGMLSAKRGSAALAICPNCTLLVRPIFPESASSNGDMPSAKPEELASAIVETVDGGARIINLSSALAQPSSKGERELDQALGYAATRNVIVVAAAGNQGTVGSSAITRHPWVIPVAGCDLHGRPVPESNMGNSIGLRGLMAPARGVTGLSTNGNLQTSEGTSVAAPFVTGTVALLWSEFRSASAASVKSAICRGNSGARRAVVPPLLNAWAAYQAIASASRGVTS